MRGETQVVVGKNLALAAGVAAAAFVALVVMGAGCDKKQPSSASPGTDSVAAPALGSENAAQTYLSVYDALGKPLLDAVANGDAADAMLKQHAADIEKIVEASRSPSCDFGVDYSAGLETMLPHLGKLRPLARVLKADATRLLAAGDTDAAAKRVAALLRMAMQIAKPGRTMIELLVANAIALLATDIVITNESLARAAWKTDIQQAIAATQRDLVQNSGQVVQRDVEIAPGSLRQGKGLDLTPLGGRNWNAASQAEREAAAKKLDAIAAEYVRAWDQPDAVSRLKALGERAQKEGVDDLVSAPHKARESVNKLRDELAKAGAVLSK
mgnify:CR=1 FL=1